MQLRRVYSGVFSANSRSPRLSLGIKVVATVTALDEACNRVAMHAVRQELLHAQAEAAGLPLIEVPNQCRLRKPHARAALTAARRTHGLR